MDRIITVKKLISELDMSLYKYLDIHHTWVPNHTSFNGENHLRIQQSMRNYHVNTREWRDIAQHVSLAPDGLYITGRDFAWTPVSIRWDLNPNAFMVEMIGNFDIGHDILKGEQLRAILLLIKHFLKHGKDIRFHNEYSYKTCPGSSLNKEEMISMALNINNWEQWLVDDTVEAIEKLAELGKIDTPEMHIKKIKEKNEIENWLLLLVLARIAEDNKSQAVIDIDELAEQVINKLKITLDKN